VADLLAIPATAYAAVKARTVARIQAEIEEQVETAHTANRRELMARLRQQMGR
jgi:hypothetical protein